MKQHYFLVVVPALLGLSLFSCVSVSPVHSSFERAATLGKGNVELMGNYSHYVATGGGESAASNNNYGARIGYGVAKNVDMKLRYEKLVPADAEEKAMYKINYFSVIPKVSIVEKKLSFLMPVSRYNYTENDGGEISKDHIYSIAPQFIGTLTSAKNNADVSFSIKGDYALYSQDQGSDFFMGFNLGAGFSKDLDKWAIRPEVGYIFKPGEGGGWWSMGIGAQLMLPTGKKSK
jgi:hypothetical protein